jgi:hypothetical protein
MIAQLRLAGRLYAALWLALLVGAVGGSLVGGSQAVSVNSSGGGELFERVVATNGRLIGVLALAAVLVARIPEWRRPIDVAVASLLGISALGVGAAVGAGGGEVTRSLAHLPLEWAALAAAATAYVTARRGALRLCAGLCWAAVAVVIVVLAAGVEAWAPALG